jgi:hypothetical protein
LQKITHLGDGCGVGRHLAREEPPPPKDKPRWRFLVAISGILVLAFIAMAAVAALFPENGPRAAAGPTENPFPHLPGDPVVTNGGVPSATATPGPSAGSQPTRTAPARTPRATPPGSPTPPPSGQLNGVYSLLPGRVWNDGFQAEIMITNNTSSAQSWQVRVRYPESVTQYVTSWMDGYPAPAVQVSGQTVTFTGAANVPANTTVNLRFEFKKSGGDFNPVECTVNGRTCAVA